MIKFHFCRTLGILKGQIDDKKHFLVCDSNPQKYYTSRAEIKKKLFCSFFVQMKTVEIAFKIILPLADVDCNFNKIETTLRIASWWGNIVLTQHHFLNT